MQPLQRRGRRHRIDGADHLSGFNHVEVAALHGWTESVARHRIYRGLRSLRDLDG
jgi:hypothetical protein